MPYRDLAEQRAYQHRWMQQRRKRAISYLGGECAHCETTENLQFDHINAQTKDYAISKLLSAKWDRLVEELNKCQLLCRFCHLEKSRAEGSQSKLTEADIVTIKQLLNEGVTQRVIAKRFGVVHSNISYIATRKTWARVPG